MIEQDIASIIERLDTLDAKVNQLMGIIKGDYAKEGEFISMEDASKLTGLSVKTLGNYCRSQAIASSKVGGRIQIVRQSLYDYLGKNMRKTISEQVSDKVLNLN